MHVPMTHVTLWKEGLQPLGHSSSLLCMGLCLSTAQCQSAQHKALHRELNCYRTMRTFTGMLLASGAAGLQLHKGIKLAAPALPVALLPSAAVAAADSYEYGSA